MGDRGSEHHSKAKKLELTSKFYRSYPSSQINSTNEEATSLQLGNFEDLDQYCLLGFRRCDQSHQHPHSTGEEGFFCWPKGSLEKIKKTNFRGATTLEDKQLHMVGYMLELVCGLALSSDDNVSESPSFETPLGGWITPS